KSHFFMSSDPTSGCVPYRTRREKPDASADPRKTRPRDIFALWKRLWNQRTGGFISQGQVSFGTWLGTPDVANAMFLGWLTLLRRKKAEILENQHFCHKM